VVCNTKVSFSGNSLFRQNLKLEKKIGKSLPRKNDQKKSSWGKGSDGKGFPKNGKTPARGEGRATHRVYGLKSKPTTPLRVQGTNSKQLRSGQCTKKEGPGPLILQSTGEARGTVEKKLQKKRSFVKEAGPRGELQALGPFRKNLPQTKPPSPEPPRRIATLKKAARKRLENKTRYQQIWEKKTSAKRGQPFPKPGHCKKKKMRENRGVLKNPRQAANGKRKPPGPEKQDGLRSTRGPGKTRRGGSTNRKKKDSAKKKQVRGKGRGTRNREPGKKKKAR